MRVSKKQKSSKRGGTPPGKPVRGGASQRKARPILIAAVAILVVIAGLWGVKGLVEPGADAEPAGEDTAVAASSSELWDLSAKSVDMGAIAEADVPAIVDFGSDSGVPCKQMAPVLKRSNEEMRGRAIVKFVDVWKHPDAAAGFPVQVIPTQVLMMPGGKPYEPSERLAAKYGLQFSQYADDSGNLAFTTHQGALTQEQMDAILSDMGV